MLLHAQNIKKEYGVQRVLDIEKLEIRDGGRIGLIGRNGAGKSTLIKTIMEGRPETFLTSEARTACLFQDQDLLDPNKTLLEHVMEEAAQPQHICRAVLSNLYMSKEDIFKPVSVLSGGERVKTALAKVLVSGCSFMILDEPTNHMDVYTMEGLDCFARRSAVALATILP